MKKLFLTLCVLTTLINPFIINGQENNVDATSILKEYHDILNDENDIMNQATEIFTEYDSNTINEILNAGRIKLEQLKIFLNTEITQINLPQFKINDVNIKPKISISYGDLIKTTFWFSDILADAWLQRNLAQQTTDYIFDKIKHDYVNFLNKLETFNFAFAQNFDETNTNTQKNLKTAEQGLLKYIQKEHSIDYSTAAKNLLFKKTIFFLLFFEFSNLLKERWLGPLNSYSISEIIKDIKKDGFGKTTEDILQNTDGAFMHTTIKLMQSKPIPMFNIIKLSGQLYSRPLTTGISATSRIINLITEPLKKYRTENGEIKRKILFNILDSDTLFAAKKIILLIHSIKNINNNFQQKIWFEGLKQEHEKLIALINEYKNLKQSLITTSDKKEIIKQIENVENKIKLFILEKQKSSFKMWLKNKNHVFGRSENILDFISNIPILCLSGKWIYEKHKEGSLNKFFNKNNLMIALPIIGGSLFYGLFGTILKPTYY